MSIFEHHSFKGSVATWLRGDRIFNDHVRYTLSLLSPMVKEFRKSVRICRSYGQESSVLFVCSTFLDAIYSHLPLCQRCKWMYIASIIIPEYSRKCLVGRRQNGTNETQSLKIVNGMLSKCHLTGFNGSATSTSYHTAQHNFASVASFKRSLKHVDLSVYLKYA